MICYWSSQKIHKYIRWLMQIRGSLLQVNRHCERHCRFTSKWRLIFFGSILPQTSAEYCTWQNLIKRQKFPGTFQDRSQFTKLSLHYLYLRPTNDIAEHTAQVYTSVYRLTDIQLAKTDPLIQCQGTFSPEVEPWSRSWITLSASNTQPILSVTFSHNALECRLIVLSPL